MGKNAWMVLAGFVLLLPLLATAEGLKSGEMDALYISSVTIPPSVRAAAKEQNRELELQRLAETLESQLSVAINGTRLFQLVERKDLATVQAEQLLIAPAAAPEAALQASKTGRLLGARYVLLPVLDGFEDFQVQHQMRDVERSEVKRNLYASAVIRIVDTATAAYLPEVPSLQLSKVDERIVKSGDPLASEALLVSLARELAQRLCYEVLAQLRPAKVLNVSGKQLLINRGSDAGFAVGDLVEIYAVQLIKDDENGEDYRNEIPVGQAKITRIDKKQSFAMLSGDDLGVTRGCVVKLFQSAANLTAPTEKPSPAATVPAASDEKPLNWR